MKELRVKSFGPIARADVEFGDLTLLVGPQASGKSIFLQLLKLLIDKYSIRSVVEQFNLTWKDEKDILNRFFGEGMSGIWRENSEIILDQKTYSRDFLLPKRGRNEGKAKKNPEEQLFYIPAQRILSMPEGRTRGFAEFDISAPFVLRYFSENIRLLLQNGMETSIFPIKNRLKGTLRDLFDKSIFHGGKVFVDDSTGERKFRMEVGGMNVPFITWSAGQKEFMPLLLTFYYLCPPAKINRKDDYQYVVIEEPEMGLHPQAIKSVILQVIDLLSRDYKVIISTHSPMFLEFAWAYNMLKKEKAPDKSLYELFEEETPQGKQLLKGILSAKTINSYYFSRENDVVITKDISSLDANSEDIAISEWGGISSFAGRSVDIVSQYITDEN